jgi:N-methylhydantoinase A/oxoprolinase/acetone carboxylase beta subunit
MSHRIGADIGGTFTDLVVVDEAGSLLRIAKVLTTPEQRTRPSSRGSGKFSTRPSFLPPR